MDRRGRKGIGPARPSALSLTPSTRASSGLVSPAWNFSATISRSRVALRTALLRKLALAITTASIDSLRLQIRDANAAIASDLASLRDIQRQVTNSHIELMISSVTPPSRPRSPSPGGGFTLPRAVHDAKRVLVVAAGVGLIALAVLVPAGLLVALGLWSFRAVRRHRRERVLDLM